MNPSETVSEKDHSKYLKSQCWISRIKSVQDMYRVYRVTHKKWDFRYDVKLFKYYYLNVKFALNWLLKDRSNDLAKIENKCAPAGY